MAINLNEKGTGFLKFLATCARLSCTLSLESTLNTAIMSYRNLPPCYERFSDAFDLAEVVCAVVVICLVCHGDKVSVSRPAFVSVSGKICKCLEF